MPEWSERDVIELARELGRLQPSGQSAAQALTAVRAKLTAKRSWVGRYFMRGAIAASVIGAVVMVSMLAIHSSASAAQVLSDIVEKAVAYKGWVHVAVTMKGGGRMVNHFNSADGTAARVTELPSGRRSITWLSPAQGQLQSYGSESNELRIADAGSATLFGKSSPETLQEAMAQVRLMLRSFKPQVQQEPDGDLKRFTVSAAGADPDATPIERVTIWVEPTTALVHRLKVDVGQQPKNTKLRSVGYEQTYSYGGAAIEDIYSLGVPRDAKVVDLRMDGPTRDLVGKALRVMRPDLGDYAAVQVQGATEAGKPARGGGITLFGRSGDMWFIRNYSVMNPMAGVEISPHSAPLPKGWPAPTVEEAMESLKDQPVREVKAGDAQKRISVRWDPATGDYVKKAVPAPNSGEDVLTSSLYPDRYLLEGGSPSQRITRVEDAAHAGLLGIRVAAVSPQANLNWTEHVFWVDPQRGHALVAYIRTEYKGSARQREPLGYQYKAWRELADGTPYPSQWVETFWNDVTRKLQSVEKSLIIKQGIKPEPEWGETAK